MKTSATNRRLRILLTAIGNESLIPQPEFQRRLVWSNKDKVAFVRTVLEGYPFPEIYIASGKVDPKTGEGTELLVDGQQRLTTLYQYFKGSPDLKLPKDMRSYAELSEPEQIGFLEYEVVVRDLGNKPIATVKEIFQRINSTNYGLNAMEIHNARYGGEFKEFGEKISQNAFFESNRFFTATDIKRMNDVRYCLVLAITVMRTYFNRDTEIEEYLEKYNESFDEAEDLNKEINGTLSAIGQLDLPTDCRAFKKADFLTLFVEMHRATYKKNMTVAVDSTRKNLLSFYGKVENASQGRAKENADELNYYKAALQASNDRGNRILRGQIIEKLLAYSGQNRGSQLFTSNRH